MRFSGSFSRIAFRTDSPPMPESTTRTGPASAIGGLAGARSVARLQRRDDASQNVYLWHGKSGPRQHGADIMHHGRLVVGGTEIAGRIERALQMLDQPEELRLWRRGKVDLRHR